MTTRTDREVRSGRLWYSNNLSSTAPQQDVARLQGAGADHHPDYGPGMACLRPGAVAVRVMNPDPSPCSRGSRLMTQEVKCLTLASRRICGSDVGLAISAVNQKR